MFCSPPPPPRPSCLQKGAQSCSIDCFITLPSFSAGVNWATGWKATVENTAEEAPGWSPGDRLVPQQCPLFPGWLLNTQMQKTLVIMKKDFCSLVTARSRVKSLRYHSHRPDFLDNTKQSLSLSVPQFPFCTTGSSAHAAAQAELLGFSSPRCRSPQRTSLLLTSWFIFADELQLCN